MRTKIITDHPNIIKGKILIVRGYKVLSFLGFITQLAPNMSKQTKEKQ